jgi:hypothetical protein
VIAQMQSSPLPGLEQRKVHACSSFVPMLLFCTHVGLPLFSQLVHDLLGEIPTAAKNPDANLISKNGGSPHSKLILRNGRPMSLFVTK